MNNDVEERERANVQTEPIMNEAMERIQQQIEYSGSSFLVQKQEFQRERKRERDMIKLKQLCKVNIVNNDLYSLR